MSLQRSKTKRIAAMNREPAIRVCLIGGTLACSYLRDILKQNSDIQILSQLPVTTGGCEAETEPLIFAIDSDSLPGQLVECLVSIKLRFSEAKMLLIGKELSDLDIPQLRFLSFHGFLPYEDVKDKLVSAIRVIAKDGNWLGAKECPAFSRTLERSTWRPGTAQSNLLTHRENLVVGLVGRMMCNKEIAVNLHVSESTVKFHLANIFRKLGVHDRHSALLLATIASASPFPWRAPGVAAKN